MSGRYIGDNLRLIYDLIAYLNEANVPGLLLNIDFEKAFDSVDWTFMFKVLKAFGFKEGICGWVRTFYTNIKSTVIVNGQASQWFPIYRGCRQGDPISPYLFILCVEILGIMIRENNDIKGIFVNGIEHKLSQYADDTEFLLAGDRESFESCVTVIDNFGRKSGLYMNAEKTSAVWLGSRRNSVVKYMQHLGMEWNPPKFKILGIWFTNNLENCENINYSEKFAEVKNLMRIWMKRQITPLGRVAILKSLVLSKLIHLWILLPNPPDECINSLQKLCYEFVWSKKQDKISRKTAHKSVQNGGLCLPHLKTFISALKLTWIRKFINTNHKWKNVVLVRYPFIKEIERYGPKMANTYPKCNAFWNQVFNAYDEFYNKIRLTNIKEVLNEPICFNERIKVGNTFLAHKNWIDKGIYCVAHFLSEEGRWLSHVDFNEKFDTSIDFVTYSGCKLAIKKFVRNSGFQVYNSNVINVTACLQKLYSTNKGCKLYYDVLNEDDVKPNCCSKWEEKLNTRISWQSCFYHVCKINDVNMKWFQMRIIHRIIGTNVVLKEMGVTDNNKCSFCFIAKDTIQHIFWECTFSQQFWTRFVILVNEKCSVSYRLRMSECLVLFGTDDSIKTESVFDFILLLAKQYLYKCKMESSQPNIDLFRKKLSFRYKIEEHNAMINCSGTSFSAKWQPYKPIFTE
jgi:hypothetical protein